MNKKLLILSFFSILTFNFLIIPSISAQDLEESYPDSYLTLPTPNIPMESDNTEVNNIMTYDIKGEITRIEGEMLFIKENDVTRSVRVPGNTSITIDGKNSNLSDLEPGFQAEITVTQSTNDVVAIDATSNTNQNLSRYLLIALAVIVILAILGLILKSSKKDHIKTGATV